MRKFCEVLMKCPVQIYRLCLHMDKCSIQMYRLCPHIYKCHVQIHRLCQHMGKCPVQIHRLCLHMANALSRYIVFVVRCKRLSRYIVFVDACQIPCLDTSSLSTHAKSPVQILFFGDTQANALSRYSSFSTHRRSRTLIIVKVAMSQGRDNT